MFVCSRWIIQKYAVFNGFEAPDAKIHGQTQMQIAIAEWFLFNQWFAVEISMRRRGARRIYSTSSPKPCLLQGSSVMFCVGHGISTLAILSAFRAWGMVRSLSSTSRTDAPSQSFRRCGSPWPPGQWRISWAKCWWVAWPEGGRVGSFFCSEIIHSSITSCDSEALSLEITTVYVFFGYIYRYICLLVYTCIEGGSIYKTYVLFMNKTYLYVYSRVISQR